MQEKNRTVSFKEQFTFRGMIIGILGSIILTMSSMFVALKLGALPWPIIFVALVSMFSLKLLGNTNINEINVTHTAMSAGAMVAGGLAFTLPGIYILDNQAEIPIFKLLIVSISGTILGLIFTALIRKYFVETKALPFPMGIAAADTLIAGDEGGKKAALLFGSFGFAALFTVFRDGMKVLASPVIMIKKMLPYGSLGGVYLSPMMIAVGFIIGPVYIGVWFLGAVIGDIVILIGGQETGILDAATASAIKSSLGIGLMVGTGVGIIVKGILPKAKEIFAPMFRKDSMINLRWSPIVFVLLAVIFTTVLEMGVIPSILLILGVWLATAMSAQCVGQTGINPMEIFGVIILLAVKAVSSIGQIELFLIAAVVAVACGLVGDVMNDFKAGYILKSDPKAQWLGESIGGIVGSVVAVAVFWVIFTAYGASAFGNPDMFPAPQASMVAAMVGGISHVPAFVVGLVAAVILYIVNFPVMTLGLGVYLPFYLSLTGFLGGLVRFVTDRIVKNKETEGSFQIAAAGLLGGEAVIGVIIALFQAFNIMRAI